MRISDWSSDVCSSDLGEAAEEAARDIATLPAGLVRVAAPMTFGMAYLAPVIAEFLDAHPGIEIDLNLSDAQVDIVAEGFDVALRIAALPDSSLRARRLCGIAVHVVAAPAYLDRHGRPTHPAQLADHARLRDRQSVGWGTKGAEQV